MVLRSRRQPRFTVDTIFLRIECNNHSWLTSARPRRQQILGTNGTGAGGIAITSPTAGAPQRRRQTPPSSPPLTVPKPKAEQIIKERWLAPAALLTAVSARHQRHSSRALLPPSQQQSWPRGPDMPTTSSTSQARRGSHTSAEMKTDDRRIPRASRQGRQITIGERADRSTARPRLILPTQASPEALFPGSTAKENLQWREKYEGHGTRGLPLRLPPLI